MQLLCQQFSPQVVCVPVRASVCVRLCVSCTVAAYFCHGGQDGDAGKCDTVIDQTMSMNRVMRGITQPLMLQPVMRYELAQHCVTSNALTAQRSRSLPTCVAAPRVQSLQRALSSGIVGPAATRLHASRAAWQASSRAAAADGIRSSKSERS